MGWLRTMGRRGGGWQWVHFQAWVVKEVGVNGEEIIIWDVVREGRVFNGGH